MTIDTKALRELATNCERWFKDGCPTSDPFDTYPNDLFDAATQPKDIIKLLEEIDRLRKIEFAHNNLLNTKYNDREATPQESLYRIWNVLPACNLLAAIGDVLQDFSYMQHELSNMRAIKSAAENLKKAKGRHNSEIAMNKLLEALK